MKFGFDEKQSREGGIDTCYYRGEQETTRGVVGNEEGFLFCEEGSELLTGMETFCLKKDQTPFLFLVSNQGASYDREEVTTKRRSGRGGEVHFAIRGRSESNDKARSSIGGRLVDAEAKFFDLRVVVLKICAIALGFMPPSRLIPINHRTYIF
ncbi:hypothetical protein M5K25_025909 [Dendrobium thyrsiflorum]|uniref:Uncharacterized protein n=1 Tax=Dendrobium thyrsiflorum TaxID=117978 RepID=A0ABD0TVZ0_DENTH